MDSMTATSPWHLDERNRAVQVDGYEWRYVDTGSSGPAIVLLPGSVGTHEVFFKQIRALGDMHRIVAATYPACETPEQVATAFVSFVRHLKLEGALVVGSSYAAYWLQIVATAHPQLARGYIFGNGFTNGAMVRNHPLFSETLIAQDADIIQRTWHEAVTRHAESELRSMQLDMLGGRQPASVLRSRLLAVIGAKDVSVLQLPAERIVVMDCADDPIITTEARDAFAKQFPGATRITLDRGGHYPHVLNPEAYNEVLQRSA
ncbi:alpha/beta hydrolase [Paraburkholderia sp. 22B1P]|uniref:alpha/beta fold hydrolase n=1 Tax=Paraburkholderia sp. 22B1P TaxID=3080498 RepID=UPI00308B3A0E|nr:alpha/beta hydrolase [Paraburkholderia sp. 22B1P]